MEFFRPFGPIIAKVRFPDFLVERLNLYADEVIREHETNLMADVSDILVPTEARVLRNVRHEFRVSQKFLAGGANASIAQYAANFVVEYLRHLEQHPSR